jgi:hypothetical protein
VVLTFTIADHGEARAISSVPAALAMLQPSLADLG